MTAGETAEWKHEMAPQNSSNTWFVVDKEGLRKTVSRKGKAFAIYELLQNGYDENSTKLEVTLTEPKNGKSVTSADLALAMLSEKGAQ